jgi:prolyl-tRNA synthetase
MFSDADLIGIPLRVVVSPRTLERGAIEISARDKSFALDADLESAPSVVRTKIQEMIDEINSKL